MLKNLFGSPSSREGILPELNRNPYYIYAPAYTHSSAGIRVLHLLCHWLNRKGQMAFIAPFQAQDNYINFDLCTPLLTPEVHSFHASQNLTPIVVYPEVISGNPLQASCVVRYLLNLPGLLGGDRYFAETDSVWAFSRYLAEQVDRCDGILHMPVIDERIFNPGNRRKRQGILFYASKFKGIHRQNVFSLPADAVEITKGRPDSPNQRQIAEMLRGAEYLYCFENSAIATEAVLCGCPAVFVPNDFLKQAIASHELGWDGYAWGTDHKEMLRAKRTVGRGQKNYSRSVSHFFVQLHEFTSATQQLAKQAPKAGPLDLSSVFSQSPATPPAS